MRINALARRQARGRNQAEARQVGQLALLEALELFEPGRGVAFWTFAFPKVRRAIADWASNELGAKRSRKRADHPEMERALARSRPDSFDEQTHGGEDATPESLLIEAEEYLRLEVFVAGLSVEDRASLVPSVGRPKKDRADRNNSIRARARRFLEGT